MLLGAEEKKPIRFHWGRITYC